MAHIDALIGDLNNSPIGLPKDNWPNTSNIIPFQKDAITHLFDFFIRQQYTNGWSNENHLQI